jgi:hypothetical protein
MKFYNGALSEARTVADRVSLLDISKIEIGVPLYPVDEENVARLAEAYRRGDVVPPVRVQLLTDPARPLAEARYQRIYGLCRMRARTEVGYAEIEVEIVTCTDAEALRMEARENLDRRTLNADQRMHGIAAILQSKLEEQSVPLGPKGPTGHRAEGGLSKAARDEGISETAAKRAMRIVDITPEAKALYRAKLPDIKRIDLEEIAAAPSERQVEVTRRVIDERQGGRPRIKAVPQTTVLPFVMRLPAADSSSELRADQSDGTVIQADCGDPGEGPRPLPRGKTSDITSRADLQAMGSHRDGMSETDLQGVGDETKPPPAGPTDKHNDADDPRQVHRSKVERDFDRLQKSWQAADEDARQHFVAWLDGEGVLEPLLQRAPSKVESVG